jgi:N-acyl-D-amino-acid deacylase
MYDLIIRDGVIIDGSGNPWFKADIAIEDGKIKRVSRVISQKAEIEINAKKLVVPPGFIDIHTHSDVSLLVNPYGENKVKQGVTTDVIGNCGFSPAPITNATSKKYIVEFFFQELGIGGRIPDFNWRTFGEYLCRFEDKGIGINIAPLVGHSTLRANVIGYEPQKATNAEIDDMKKLLAESMKDGAFGLSTGLVYSPGANADTREIIELCKVVSKYGGIYATHIRGLRENLIDAVKEAIEIAEKATVPLQISHLCPQYGGSGLNKKALELMDEARGRGVEVTCDLHLDLVGGTDIKAVFPPWVKDGGIERFVERLRDKEVREGLKREIPEFTGPGTSGLIKHKRWDLLTLIASDTHRDLEGKSFSEISQLRGKDPFEVMFDLIIESSGEKITIGGPYTNEGDNKVTLKHPLSMVATDAWTIIDEPFFQPRCYSTFVRVIERYVLKEKLIPLEMAIRKMTSMPALKLGLMDRGLIRENMWADIVILSLDNLKETTREELQPRKNHDFPKGIEYVLVNGQIVVEKGELTKSLPGKVLKRRESKNLV